MASSGICPSSASLFGGPTMQLTLGSVAPRFRYRCRPRPRSVRPNDGFTECLMLHLVAGRGSMRVTVHSIGRFRRRSPVFWTNQRAARQAAGLGSSCPGTRRWATAWELLFNLRTPAVGVRFKHKKPWRAGATRASLHQTRRADFVFHVRHERRHRLHGVVRPTASLEQRGHHHQHRAANQGLGLIVLQSRVQSRRHGLDVDRESSPTANE